MFAVTSRLAVRARVPARPEPPHDRLYDPVAADVIAGGPMARLVAGSWRDDDDVRSRAAKRSPFAPELAREMREQHVRLGASRATLDALDRLTRGEACCAIAGQQPGPLGGRLFGLHKAAAAVGIARRVEARTGVPCVAVYWNHVEDSDFEEIRGATVGDSDLALHDLALPAEAHSEGGLVGAIPLPPVRALSEVALGHWSALPGHAELARLQSHALDCGQDLGEAHAALLLGLFAEVGLIVIDPRLPAFRAAARPVIERYLGRADALAAIVRTAGEAVEARIGRRPLNDAALESFVFAIEDGRRRKASPAEAKALGPAVPLSPSVALRPIVQDAVLPTVAMASGPGELAYLAQLGRAFGELGVEGACPVPRYGATWLPPSATELIEASGADPWSVVAATDHVLRAHAESRVPADLARTLQDLREEIERGLAAFAGDARALDASLPQMVESARGKIDFQIGRLVEGLTGKVRHRIEREHPRWLHLRYYLLPGDKLQERRLSTLEPVAYRGLRVIGELCDRAEAHAEALERGELTHELLELG